MQSCYRMTTDDVRLIHRAIASFLYDRFEESLQQHYSVPQIISQWEAAERGKEHCHLLAGLAMFRGGWPSSREGFPRSCGTKVGHSTVIYGVMALLFFE